MTLHTITLLLLIATCGLSQLQGSAAQTLSERPVISGGLPEDSAPLTGDNIPVPSPPTPSPSPAPPPPGSPGGRPERDAASAQRRDSRGGEKPRQPRGPILDRLRTKDLSLLVRQCGCSDKYDDPLDLEGIRDISNAHMSGGSARSTKGLSNLLWSFGQWIDHDVVGTKEGEHGSGDSEFTILLDGLGANPTRPVPMGLTRLEAERGKDGCRLPITTVTPQIDAGPVYSNDEEFRQKTLRDGGRCRLRRNMESKHPREHLPLTSLPNENGRRFFVAGDLRVNEHAVLSSMHTIWMREHNRLCNQISRKKRTVCKDVKQYDGRTRRECKRVTNKKRTEDEKFDLVRQVVMAKNQHITLKEYLPALGISESRVRNFNPKLKVPDVSVEFSTSAYRMGHDLVPDMIGAEKVAALFGGERYFLEDDGVTPKPDAILDTLLRNAAAEEAGDIDGRLGDALRNILFGPREGFMLGEDLASRNLFRGRDMGLVSYEAMGRCFRRRGPATRVPSSVLDSFPHLLAGDASDGDVLNPLTRVILLDQFHRLMFGPGGLFYTKESVEDLWDEVASTTLAKVINANSGANVQPDAFRAL